MSSVVGKIKVNESTKSLSIQIISRLELPDSNGAYKKLITQVKSNSVLY